MTKRWITQVGMGVVFYVSFSGSWVRKKEASDEKGVPTGVTDTRLITPYPSYLLRGFQ
ncbi:MAG: hypothetical protein QGH37_21865 [Candidatus Poribacteria bacterium]|nr:hypothetical protein [Candidatus Poribacteria bacterium]